jgi:hypothetical protein
MPLFMDRHDTPGASAQEVAQAHARDVELSAKYGVKFLSYWFDEEHGGVYCFAKAAGSEDVTAVHQESHGLLPNEIISVSEDDVLRFLGGIQDPADYSELKSPFRAILFTDLEGSTSLLQEVGESEFMVLLTEHDLIIRRALAASWGSEVKHTGDGIMASFENVAHALRCAAAIQDGFDARADSGATPELRVRIGIAAGEPVRHNDDIFGSAVNLASRICDAADAGHILVSDVVYDLGAAEGFAFEAADERDLKGFTSPTRVFKLVR